MCYADVTIAEDLHYSTKAALWLHLREKLCIYRNQKVQEIACQLPARSKDLN